MPTRPHEYPTVYMPSTGRPAPPLLTEAEFIELLRLDEIKSLKYPQESLRKLRKAHPQVIRAV